MSVFLASSRWVKHLWQGKPWLKKARLKKAWGLVAVAVFVAACGGDSDDTTPATSAAPETTAAATTIPPGEFHFESISQRIDDEQDFTHSSAPDGDESQRGAVLSEEDVLAILLDPDNAQGFTYSSHRSADDEWPIAASQGVAASMSGTDLTVATELGNDPEKDEAAKLALADLSTWYSAVRPLFDKDNVWIGGWRNPETGRYEVNITLVFVDVAEAERFGKQENQGSVFNLETFESIETGGDGGPGFST